MKSPSTKLLFVAAVIGAAVIGIPVALASHTFSDVPPGNPHHDDISFIADLGVTTGCAPDLYCPADPVRRDQMASFLARTIRLLSQAPRHYQVTGEFSAINPSSFAVVEASCAAGDVPTGGGYSINGVVGTTISFEGMSINQRGWQVFAFNPTASTNNIAGQVMCLDYSP